MTTGFFGTSSHHSDSARSSPNLKKKGKFWTPLFVLSLKLKSR